MVLAKQDCCMQKNPNASIVIMLHKTQIRMDQEPEHNARHNESDRKESGG